LHLKYYGPAHTDGDISVTFAEADILHTGDTFWNGIYPFIDYSTGGGIDGLIKATEPNLAAATDKTIIIPGHGNPVSNRTELSAYRDMLVASLDNVARLKQQGRSLKETIEAKPTGVFDADVVRALADPRHLDRGDNVSPYSGNVCLAEEASACWLDDNCIAVGASDEPEDPEE